MEPLSIGMRDAFNVLGVQVRIDPWKADYRQIWEEQYMPHDEAVSELATQEGYYAVYFSTDEPGKVDMLAGRATGDVDAVPEGLTLREVKAACRAVFECQLHEIATTWQAIYDVWLAGSEKYANDDGKGCFEYFPPGSEEGKVPLTIHVAVKEE